MWILCLVVQRHGLAIREGPSEGVTWHPENWLQLPEDKPFPRLTLN